MLLGKSSTAYIVNQINKNIIHSLIDLTLRFDNVYPPIMYIQISCLSYKTRDFQHESAVFSFGRSLSDERTMIILCTP